MTIGLSLIHMKEKMEEVGGQKWNKEKFIGNSDSDTLKCLLECEREILVQPAQKFVYFSVKPSYPDYFMEVVIL